MMLTMPWSSVHDQMRVQFPPDVHPYAILDRAILDRLGPSASVLEIGCCRDAASLAALVGRAGRLRGIDLVEFRASPPHVELIRASVSSMPEIEGGSVDLAFSRSVMEHIEDVAGAYAEIARVLRPGGAYIFLTPNLYDYATIVARLVPNRFHPWIVNKVQGRAEQDVFPTFYRSNSIQDVHRLAYRSGLEIKDIRYLGQYPAYLKFSRPLFWLGCRYESLLARIEALHLLRGWLLVTLVKSLTS